MRFEILKTITENGTVALGKISKHSGHSRSVGEGKGSGHTASETRTLSCFNNVMQIILLKWNISLHVALTPVINFSLNLASLQTPITEERLNNFCYFNMQIEYRAVDSSKNTFRKIGKFYF